MIRPQDAAKYLHYWPDISAFVLSVVIILRFTPLIPDRKGRSSRPYPGTTLNLSPVSLYLFVHLSMSIKVFFGFSIEARGSRCHNVLRVPAWLTNGALHFPTILRTMVPHEYPALICLPFLGNRGARCLCPCCLCSESSRVLETIITSLFTCNLENYVSLCSCLPR